MTKAEISQSKLKHCSSQEVDKFAQIVLTLLNPKFEDEYEAKLAFDILSDFSATSELTPAEMIIAIKMAMDKKLSYEENGEIHTVKIFREIDRSKLGEIQHAYIEHKRADKQHEKAKEEIKLFLEPPKKEPTAEEIEQNRIKFLSTEWERLKNENAIMGTNVFYDILKNITKVVKISFVENILANFVHETNATGLSTNSNVLPKIIKHDARQHFINKFVIGYIMKEKLNEVSKEEWIEHWTNLSHKKDNPS